MNWTALHPRADELVGIIPSFLSEADPRPARAQIDEAYAHGGGWHPLSGWLPQPTNINADGRNVPALQYPGDPIYRPVAFTLLRDELIVVYSYAWVGIFQPTGEFSVARLD